MSPSLVLAVLAAAGASAQTRGGFAAAPQVDAAAKVRGVDARARTLELKREDGRRVVLEVPERAGRLEELKPGARIRVRYLEGLVLAVGPEDQSPLPGEAVLRVFAADGIPAEAPVPTRQIKTRIRDVDLGRRELTAEGPDGRDLILAIPDGLRGRDELKSGQELLLRYAPATALELR